MSEFQTKLHSVPSFAFLRNSSPFMIFSTMRLMEKS